MPGNVWVISARANAIKNDATPTELRRVADAVEERMTKFQGGPLLVAPGESKAYRDGWERVFGSNGKKLCTCPKDSAAKCDPCHCCGAEEKEPCKHPVAHRSDCAVHNEPAYPNGPCNCGTEDSPCDPK